MTTREVDGQMNAFDTRATTAHIATEMTRAERMTPMIVLALYQAGVNNALVISCKSIEPRPAARPSLTYLCLSFHVAQAREASDSPQKDVGTMGSPCKKGCFVPAR